MFLYLVYSTLNDYPMVWKSLSDNLGREWTNLADFLGFKKKEIDKIAEGKTLDEQLLKFANEVKLPKLEQCECIKLVLDMLHSAGLLNAASEVKDDLAQLK